MLTCQQYTVLEQQLQKQTLAGELSCVIPFKLTFNQKNMFFRKSTSSKVAERRDLQKSDYLHNNNEKLASCHEDTSKIPV